jgi:hypothetical protein
MAKDEKVKSKSKAKPPPLPPSDISSSDIGDSSCDISDGYECVQFERKDKIGVEQPAQTAAMQRP